MPFKIAPHSPKHMHKLGWLFKSTWFSYCPDIHKADAVIMVGAEDYINPELYRAEPCPFVDYDEDLSFHEANLMSEYFITLHQMPVIGIGKYCNMLATAFEHPSIQFCRRPKILKMYSVNTGEKYLVRSRGSSLVYPDTRYEDNMKVLAHCPPYSEDYILDGEMVFRPRARFLEPEVIYFSEGRQRGLGIQSYPHLQDIHLQRFYQSIILNFMRALKHERKESNSETSLTIVD